MPISFPSLLSTTYNADVLSAVSGQGRRELSVHCTRWQERLQDCEAVCCVRNRQSLTPSIYILGSITKSMNGHSPLQVPSTDRASFLPQNWAGDLKLQAARSIIETVRKVFKNCRMFREEMPSEDIKEAKMDFTNMVSFTTFLLFHHYGGAFVSCRFLVPMIWIYCFLRHSRRRT